MRSLLLLAGLGLAASFRSPVPRGRPRSLRRMQPSMLIEPHIGAMASLMDPLVLSHAVQGLAQDAADVASEVAKSDQGGGPLGPLIAGTSFAITGLHDLLKGLGLQNPYGYAIILFTLLIKAVTFPLNAKQLESTGKMQAINPKIREIQTKFANNPEKANQMIAQLYQQYDINPLAGCLPSLAQIPIFIALYRSILNLSKDNVLTEPFLWLPSLEGPTYGAEQKDALQWLTTWQDGAPMLGWHDTLCFLTIPVILVLSQKISQKVLQSDAQQPEGASAAILNILPFMIGWFSLNVPSGLGIYWIVNNVVTTALSAFLRAEMAKDPAIMALQSNVGVAPTPTSGPGTTPSPTSMSSSTTSSAPPGFAAGPTVDVKEIEEEESAEVDVVQGDEDEEGEEDMDLGSSESVVQREAKKQKRKAQKKARKVQRKKR